MAATAAAATGGAPKLSHASSNSNRRRLDPSKKLTGSIKFLIKTPNHSSASSIQRQFTTQASKDPQTEEQEESSIDDNAGDASTFEEDLSYLWKLGVGSFVGAAVIKYGSILFPEITRPNISLALVMISTPVVVAVWLLIKQSS
ncbi:hypothetical protein AB3S75_003451 [Citrus x aurantiifolia]